MKGQLTDVLRLQPNQPMRSLLFTALVVAGAVTLLLVEFQTGSTLDWWAIAFFVTLSAAGEFFPVRLLKTGSVSVGFSISFAAILLFDPPGSVLVGALGILIGNVANNFYLDHILFNSAMVALASGLASKVFMALGGTPGDLSGLGSLFMAIVAALGVYVLVNLGIVVCGMALDEGMSARDMWQSNVRWVLANYLSLGALGLLGAAVYTGPLGAVGILLLFIPLLIARFGFQQYMDVHDAHMETVRALSAALDAKDKYTRGHSDRVAELSAMMARRLGMSEEEIDEVRHAALLHDVGKISIQDAILNKTGQLEPDEYAVVKTHAAIGASIVGESGFFYNISRLIRHHHEWYDGRGYPDQIKGDAIPLGARVIAVADAFDAMTSGRTYRKGMPQEEAVKRLRASSGSQFDPCIVTVLFEYLGVQQMEPEMEVEAPTADVG